MGSLYRTDTDQRTALYSPFVLTRIGRQSNLKQDSTDLAKLFPIYKKYIKQFAYSFHRDKKLCRQRRLGLDKFTQNTLLQVLASDWNRSMTLEARFTLKYLLPFAAKCMSATNCLGNGICCY